MRRIPFCILLGFVVIVLSPASVQSQFPSRSSGGSSSGRSMFGDPTKLFEMMSGGKDVVSRDTLPNPLFAGMFDRFAQQMGVTNGQITREQFNAYMAQKMAGAAPDGQAAPAPAPGGGPPPWAGKGGGSGGDQADMADRWADSMFRRYDGNGDGLLNYDEMPENLRIERDKFDENRDGFVDLTEYKSFFKASMQQRIAEGRDFPPPPASGSADPETPDDEEPPKPVVYRAGKLPKEMPAWFKTCDTDGDGQVTLYEWRTAGRALAEFQSIDRNGDGFVTIAEVMYTVQGKYNYNGVAVATTTAATPATDKPATETRSGSEGRGSMFGRGSTDAKGGFGRSSSSDKGGETGKGGFRGFGKR